MKLITTICLLTNLVVPALGLAPPRYQAELLPPGHRALDINNHGDVLVETSIGLDYVRKANGTSVFLDDTIFPAELSDSGIVTGSDTWDKPFHYDTNSGVLTQLTMPAGYVAGFPFAPNIHGVGIGTVAQTPFGAGDAIRWNSPTDWEFLHMPNGSIFGEAYEINDNGVIRGRHGFGDDVLWLPGQGNASYVRPFGRSVGVRDLTNTRGMVATDNVSGPKKSYIINFDLTVQATIVNPLGADKSISASSMNESGWVGMAMQVVAGSANYRAALWSQHTGVIDVQSLIDNPPSDFHVNGVNISDSMVMYGTDLRTPENPRYYILTPVPEPTSFMLLTAGIAAMLRRRRS